MDGCVQWEPRQDRAYDTNDLVRWMVSSKAVRLAHETPIGTDASGLARRLLVTLDPDHAVKVCDFVYDTWDPTLASVSTIWYRRLGKDTMTCFDTLTAQLEGSKKVNKLQHAPRAKAPTGNGGVNGASSTVDQSKTGGETTGSDGSDGSEDDMDTSDVDQELSSHLLADRTREHMQEIGRMSRDDTDSFLVMDAKMTHDVESIDDKVAIFVPYDEAEDSSPATIEVNLKRQKILLHGISHHDGSGRVADISKKISEWFKSLHEKEIDVCTWEKIDVV